MKLRKSDLPPSKPEPPKPDPVAPVLAKLALDQKEIARGLTDLAEQHGERDREIKAALESAVRRIGKEAAASGVKPERYEISVKRDADRLLTGLTITPIYPKVH